MRNVPFFLGAAAIVAAALSCTQAGPPPGGLEVPAAGPSAETRPEWAPSPGGSPFPPGKEPDQTHEVKVYWTTRDGVVTRIDVTAASERPTQAGLLEFKDGKLAGGVSMIAPECDHHVRIAAEKPAERIDGVADWVHKGDGVFLVKVFGFTAADFAAAPVVTARYYRDGVLIGETSVAASPMPEKLKTH